MIRLDINARHPDGTFILFQEQVVAQGERNPWSIACGSVVLQRTGRVQAFPVIEQLLNEWSPLRCSNDQAWSFRQLVNLLKPAGLAETKALRIAAFSRDYLKGIPVDLWPGLKGYTRDSVLIFTDGKYLTYKTEVLPTDKHLAQFVRRWREVHGPRSAPQDSSEGTNVGHSPGGSTPDRGPADHLGSDEAANLRNNNA